MENSIEETIKIIERKIKEAEHYTDITGLYLTLDKELCNAFINILSDYKRVLKENEELEEINNELEAEKNEAIRRYNFESIPVYLVEEKIEEIQKEYEETLKTANFKEIEKMNKINFRGITLEGQRSILRELLEKRK